MKTGPSRFPSKGDEMSINELTVILIKAGFTSVSVTEGPDGTLLARSLADNSTKTLRNMERALKGYDVTRLRSHLIVR